MKIAVAGDSAGEGLAKVLATGGVATATAPAAADAVIGEDTPVPTEALLSDRPGVHTLAEELLDHPTQLLRLARHVLGRREDLGRGRARRLCQARLLKRLAFAERRMRAAPAPGRSKGAPRAVLQNFLSFRAELPYSPAVMAGLAGLTFEAPAGRHPGSGRPINPF